VRSRAPRTDDTDDHAGESRYLRTMTPLTSADRVQIELLRRAGPGRRSVLAGKLSADALRLARRAIAEAFPDLDEWEQRAKFLEVQHGKELADGFRRYLARRGLSGP
jgi:hypothetical protein